MRVHQIWTFFERGHLRRDRGFFDRAPMVGVVIINEVHDKARRRMVRLAEVKDQYYNHQNPHQTHRAEPPRLYEPTLIAMSGTHFTLSGIERIGNVEFAQSWLCKLVE